MRVLVDNGGYDFMNIGDTAMLRVALRRLKAELPAAELDVLTKAPEMLRRACPGVTAVPPPTVKDISHLRGRHETLYSWMPWRFYLRIQEWEDQRWLARSGWGLSGRARTTGGEVLRRLESADAVVATGGGYLTSAFEEQAQSVLSLLAAAQHSLKPTVLFGQGIGPIAPGGLYRLAAHVLPRASLVCLREKVHGYALLKELGVEEARIRITGDDAVETACTCRPANLGSLIGVDFRKSTYSGIDATLMISLARTVCRAAQNLGTKIIPVPVSHYGQEDDDGCVRNSVPDASLLAEEEGTPDLTEEHAIYSAGRCRLVLACSYHAALFALAQGIPVIVIVHSRYYESKFTGLADIFGDDACRIWRAVEAPADVLQDWIHRQWENAPEQRQRLLEIAASQVRAGCLAYREAADLINRQSP
jgi:polysaccharide pyruvyl transferase WcaK-like protein